MRVQQSSLEDEKPLPDKRMLAYLQSKIPEFENYTPISLAFLLSHARVIDLHSSDGALTPDLQQPEPLHVAPVQKSHKILDSRQLGFFMLLKGRCDIVYEVVKVRKLEHVDSSVEDDA